MSSDNYNRATNLIIVCPITITEKEKPFLIPISSNKMIHNYDSKHGKS